MVLARDHEYTLGRVDAIAIMSGVTKNLKRMTMEEEIEAYFEGYRRIPDGNDVDFIAMEKVGLEDAADAHDDWPEAPADDGSDVVGGEGP